MHILLYEALSTVYLQHFTYMCASCMHEHVAPISSTIVYLQRLEEDKRTLEQEAVLVKKELQAKDERLEVLEVHYANLIPYSK